VIAEAAGYEEELPEDHRGARFESFAFTKESVDAIGARGQGKFIFLHASNSYKMYYDTLRDDDVYRLGATQATRTGCPILPASGEWEQDHAVQVLKEECGLEPLKEVGTRVIIADPKDEILASLANGDFERAIQETWFRLIEKQQLVVTIPRADVGPVKVDVSAPYPLAERDTKNHKVWALNQDFQDDEIHVPRQGSYRVKNFHAVYSSAEPVSEGMQGIAIIHHGMKITSLPMNMAPPEVLERVTGYIEFDLEFDRELRLGINQNPNHYDLKWRRTIPQALKDYVNRQLDEFGRSKLGLGADPREAKKRRITNAEEWAMRQLQKFADDLDLFGAKGPTPPKPDPPDFPSHKEAGIAINNFRFPDPDIAPRVNYGHSLRDLSITAFNREIPAFSGLVSFAVLFADTVVLSLLDHEKVELKPGTDHSLGPFDIPVEKDVFQEAGQYRLRATFVDEITGEQIDGVTRRFWVEADPPLRQPFELFPVPNLPEPNNRRQWITSGSINNSATIYYNTSHPAYRTTEEDEFLLQDYLLQIVLEGAIKFVLSRPDSDNGTDYHPLDTIEILGGREPVEREAVPETTYSEITRYLSDFRWKMLEEE